jgi:hypothetical protein
MACSKQEWKAHCERGGTIDVHGKWWIVHALAKGSSTGSLTDGYALCMDCTKISVFKQMHDEVLCSLQQQHGKGHR